MTLRNLFAIPITVILLVTLSLAGMITHEGWSGNDRAKIAIQAVARMRLLHLVHSRLRAERVVSNTALGEAYPLPDSLMRRISEARDQTNLGIEALAASLRATAKAGANAAAPEPFLANLTLRLADSRAGVDELISHDQADRTFQALNGMMPRMFAVMQSLDQPLAQAYLDVAAANPALSGLLALVRVTSTLRDGVSQIAAVLLPRFNKSVPLTAADVQEVHALLAQQSQLTRLLEGMIETARPTGRMRTLLVDLKRAGEGGVRQQLNELMDAGAQEPPNLNNVLPPQRILVPWANQFDDMSTVILDTAVERVTNEQAERANELRIVVSAVGVVLAAILASLALLSWYVVAPLAKLGTAITRIAAGDRGTRLVLKSGTREITEMVAAVETLREAAVVADESVSRQREAARRRFEALREALGIVQTIQEPARTLERNVVRLSEGIDAAITLATTANSAVPATLGAAADAVRLGLANLRGSAAALDATFAAALTAEPRDQPEAEIVAHILAVQAQVDRRDAALHLFIQPSLLALRDAAAGEAHEPMLGELVNDQFQRIEATVAAMSSMRASMARAANMARQLPPSDTRMAA